MSKGIVGLKLIRHNAGGVDLPDDPSFPFKLEACFRAPEFMALTFVMMYGPSEDIVVRSMTREALDEFVSANGFKAHPRLRKLCITGPNGEILEQYPE